MSSWERAKHPALGDEAKPQKTPGVSVSCGWVGLGVGGAQGLEGWTATAGPPVDPVLPEEGLSLVLSCHIVCSGRLHPVPGHHCPDVPHFQNPWGRSSSSPFQPSPALPGILRSLPAPPQSPALTLGLTFLQEQGINLASLIPRPWPSQGASCWPLPQAAVEAMGRHPFAVPKVDSGPGKADGGSLKHSIWWPQEHLPFSNLTFRVLVFSPSQLGLF